MMNLLVGIVLMIISLSAFVPQTFLKRFIKNWRELHTFLYWCYRLVMLFVAVAGLLIAVGSLL